MSSVLRFGRRSIWTAALVPDLDGMPASQYGCAQQLEVGQHQGRMCMRVEDARSLGVKESSRKQGSKAIIRGLWCWRRLRFQYEVGLNLSYAFPLLNGHHDRLTPTSSHQWLAEAGYLSTK